MHRVSLIILLLCWAAGGIVPAAGQALDSEETPNIIYIMADDLGIADINSFDIMNRNFYETPKIDRLAAQGMKFLQAHTNAANCSPSRAAMLSGQYYPNQPVYHVGASGPGKMIPVENDGVLPLEKITGAEMLRRNGYSTAFMGKWHVGDLSEYRPQEQGYQETAGIYGSAPHWEGGYLKPNNNPNINDAKEGEYLTDYLTRKAIEYIGDHRQGPFYLNLSYYAPHYPFQAPEGLIKKYEEKEPDRGHYHATYAAMLEILDTNIGKLMGAIDRFGIAENTMIIFYSDNGGMGDMILLKIGRHLMIYGC